MSASFPNDSGRPIVIDNGSYQCRAGWCGSTEPEVQMVNLVLKQRITSSAKRDTAIDTDVTQVGKEIENLEAVRNQMRNAFDRNVVTQCDMQECVFDYVFQQMGFQERISSALVLTEPLCNPTYCRSLMSELLFEGYQIPAVAYGVDCLFNYQKNLSSRASGATLLVDCGYTATTIVPVLGGQVDSTNARRINIGGAHLDSYLQRLLQLKYPIHSSAMSVGRCEELVRSQCHVSSFYREELEDWTDPDYYTSNVHIVQLPVSGSSASIAAAALTAELQTARARLVQERALVEKLSNKEEIVAALERIEGFSGQRLGASLIDIGVDSADELRVHANAHRTAAESIKSKLTTARRDEWLRGELTVDKIQEEIDAHDEREQARGSAGGPAFAVGPAPHPDIVKEYYQIHVGLEQCRVPELLFQPSMIGCEQGGIAEALTFVLGKYDAETQEALAADVFLTGGCAGLAGIQKRLETELKERLSSGTHFNVSASGQSVQSPELEAWKGASEWSMKEQASSCFVTKAMYEEKGGDYLIESSVSNKLPT